MKESLLNTKLPSPRDASSSTTIRRHSFPMELVHLNKNEVADLDRAQGGAKFKGKYRDYTNLGHRFMDGKFVHNLNKEVRQFHANGGAAKLEKLRKSGRHGDTELAYMPKHVADRMDRMIGGACRNPHTNKREYFLGDMLKSIGSAASKYAPSLMGAAGNMMSGSAGAPAAGGAPASGGGWGSMLGNLANAGMQGFNAYQQSGGDWKKALAAGASSGAGSLLNQYGGQNGQMINNMLQQGNQAFQNGQGMMGAARQAGMAGVNGVADRMGQMGGMAGAAGDMLRSGANAYQNGQGLMGAAQQAGMSGINGAMNNMSNMGGMAGMVGNMGRGAMNGYMQPGGNMQQAMSGAMNGYMQPGQNGQGMQPQYQQAPAQQPTKQPAKQPAKQPQQQQPMQRPQQKQPQQQQQQQQQYMQQPQYMQQQYMQDPQQQYNQGYYDQGYGYA